MLKILQSRFVRVGLSLLFMMLFIFNATFIHRLSLVESLENMIYDTKLNFTMSNQLDKRIVIVDIDDRSLLEQGRWPWSRNKIADLVDTLFDKYHVKVLGFDMVFSEPDTSSGINSLKALANGALKENAAFRQAVKDAGPSLDYDGILARSLKGRPVVLGYVFTDNNSAVKGTGGLPPPVMRLKNLDGRGVDISVEQSYSGNLKLLQDSALSGGSFNGAPDRDGSSRSVPLLREYAGMQYASLSLAVAQLALGNPEITPGFAEGAGVNESYSGFEWINLGSRKIPVDNELRALIPYHGKRGSFPYVSATDVINGKVPASLLYGAIVLFGATSPGLMDLRSTPVGNIYPGVETHANLIAGILDGNIKSKPAYAAGAELLMLLIIGVLLAFKLPGMGPAAVTATFITTVAALTGFNFWVWTSFNLVLPLASALLMVTCMFIMNVLYGFFIESRSKRHLANLFGQYVPPELVGEMAKDPEQFSLEGKSCEMSVLFSDVRDFTKMSEGLDARELVQLMNEYLTPMTLAIHHNRGTIDKYIGDMIMAFWGAPVQDDQHAQHAVQSALDMLDGLEAMNRAFAERGWPQLSIGAGINSGMMSVGNMGSVFRTAYTVMGDAVNLGSRLEGLTKTYGVSIIVSEFTRNQVTGIQFRELDLVRVKGKHQAVRIYEPIRNLDIEDEAELALYTQALAHYREQNWTFALAEFNHLSQMKSGRYLYQLYLGRIQHFIEDNPPADWDGVYTFMEK